MSAISVSCLLATVNFNPKDALVITLWQCLNDIATELKQSVETVHWAVAYSGGKDSSALSYAISQLPIPLCNITLVHVHHGLQSQADEWLLHGETFAKQLGVTFSYSKVSVDIGPRQSVEANARKARYQALRQFCRNNKAVLLLAQHEDDQLETVLLQLKRGAGPKGLAGMARQQRVEGVLQLRPWLHCSQTSISNFVTSYEIAHIQDPSNEDSRYDRNFLRNEVLPALTERWSGLAKAVSRSAHLCAQQSQLIETQVKHWLQQYTDQACILPEKPLLALSPSWQAETFRYWCFSQGVNAPTKAQLDSFLQALESSSDKQPVLHFNNVTIRRFSAALYMQIGNYEGLSERYKVPTVVTGSSGLVSFPDLHINLQLYLPEKNKINFSDIHLAYAVGEADDICVAQMVRNEKVRLRTNKKIGADKLFKAMKIPPWLRSDTLGVFYNHDLLALINAMGVYPVENAVLTPTKSINEIDSRAYLVVSPHTEPCRLV